jgi:hypothetical protein
MNKTENSGVAVGLCGVCDRSARGDWFQSGQRNRYTGVTPHDNFICAQCQEEARDRREFLDAKRRANRGGLLFDVRSADEEEELARRYAASMGRKVEAWQIPPGNGLPARG